VDGDRFLGREIAGYQIEELIGRGGMGIVYRAEHRRLGRRVAFKVIAPEITNDPRFRERFLRESRTAGSLDHPNVVPIYDAGEADGVLYMAMRLVEGTDLGTLIEREGRLDPARTASIIVQVAAALDAAHEAGLIHRDVKPSNVLIPAGGGRREHVYLSDFGLTKRLSSQSGVTASAAFLGTIAYVAPEQIEGRAVDARADQYSLACVAYECLTGHRPFEKEGDIAVLWAHMQDPFPSVGLHGLDELAAVVDPILQRAGAKDPDDRYPSCGDFAADLEAALPAPMATPTTPVTPITVPPKPGSVTGGKKPKGADSKKDKAAGGPRYERVAIVSVVGSLALVAVVAFFAWRLLSGGGATPLLEGAGLLRIDPATNVVGNPVDLASDPGAVTADDAGAWVILPNANQAALVAANGTVKTIDVGERPVGLAAGNGNIWVASAADESLSLIKSDDPSRVRSNQSLPFRPGALAVGGTLLWLVDTQSDQVWHIEFDGRGLESVGTGGGPAAVVADDQLAWVANSIDESLSRISVTGFLVDAPIGLDFSPAALAASGDDLWIVSPDGDEVVRYNIRSRAITARVAVGAHPVAIALSADAVWVANGGDGTVSRIDPATNVATSIDVAGRPVGVAVQGDTIWVAIAAN
jgi:serine/threonine-protein kinase